MRIFCTRIRGGGFAHLATNVCIIHAAYSGPSFQLSPSPDSADIRLLQPCEVRRAVAF